MADTATAATELVWLWFDDEIEPPKVCPLPWFKKMVWIKTNREFADYIEEHGMPGYIDFDYYLGGRADVMDSLYWLQIWVDDNPDFKLDDLFYYDCHSRDNSTWSKVRAECDKIRDTLQARGFKERAA